MLEDESDEKRERKGGLETAKPTGRPSSYYEPHMYKEHNMAQNYNIYLFSFAFIKKEKEIIQIRLPNRRVSMGLTVNRQMAKKLTVNRQKRNIFTVNRQMNQLKLAVKFLRYP